MPALVLLLNQFLLSFAPASPASAIKDLNNFEVLKIVKEILESDFRTFKHSVLEVVAKDIAMIFDKRKWQ